MHDVTLNGQRKQVAATWNELSPRQLQQLLPILVGTYRSPTRQRLEALQVLLGISPALLLRLSDVQLAQVLWLTDFLLREPVALTCQPLPVLRPAWYGRRYFGPADELQNVSFLEFAFADAYFLAYAHSQDAQYLDLLLGTLYRPQRRPYRPHAPDYPGDRRQPFNGHLIEAHAARLARLPVATKRLALLYYRGSRRALEQRFAHVFTPANEQQAETHPDGWMHVLRELSGGAFGPYAETGRQITGDVLAKMNDDLARAEELKREEELRQQRGR